MPRPAPRSRPLSQLTDLLGPERYNRSDPDLFLDLAPNALNVFQVEDWPSHPA